MNVYHQLNKKLEDKYGLKRGIIKYVYYALANKIQLYRKYKNINWGNVKRLVFVCKGNICRSPFAEYYTNMNIGIEALSFGVEVYGESSADSSAIKNAKLRTIDLGAHLSKGMDDVNLTSQDLLICMEPAHARYLNDLVTLTGAQITLLGLWSKKRNPFIQDPLGLSDTYFTNCFIKIEDATNELTKNILL